MVADGDGKSGVSVLQADVDVLCLVQFVAVLDGVCDGLTNGQIDGK